jgi:serine/threonine protein kinase
MRSFEEGGDYIIDNTTELPYEYIDKLGHGQTGTVTKVKDVNTGALFACKTIRVTASRKRDDRKVGYSLDHSQIGHGTTTGRPEAYTRRYAAPEVFEQEPRNSRSDVFSLGCVFLEILSAMTQAFHVESGICISQCIEPIQDELVTYRDTIAHRLFVPVQVAIDMIDLKPSHRLTAMRASDFLLSERGLYCTSCREASLSVEEGPWADTPTPQSYQTSMASTLERANTLFHQRRRQEWEAAASGSADREDMGIYLETSSFIASCCKLLFRFTAQKTSWEGSSPGLHSEVLVEVLDNTGYMWYPPLPPPPTFWLLPLHRTPSSSSSMYFDTNSEPTPLDTTYLIDDDRSDRAVIAWTRKELSGAPLDENPKKKRRIEDSMENKPLPVEPSAKQVEDTAENVLVNSSDGHWTLDNIQLWIEDADDWKVRATQSYGVDMPKVGLLDEILEEGKNLVPADGFLEMVPVSPYVW